MSKFPLELSKFRKVKSDENTSTLEHKDGHTLTIAHKNLSPKLKGQLDKLPGAQPVQKFATGGATDDETNPPASSTETTPNFLDQDNEPDTSDQVTSSQSSPMLQAESGQMPGPVKAPVAPTNPDQYGIQASQQRQLGGIEEAGAGKEAEAGAMGAQGKQAAEAQQNYQNQAIQAQKVFNDINTKLTNDRMGMIQDIQNGHIDPQRYLDNMSTGGKIATGIGLVLGGMGAGLTHGPNLAFQYLQNQIDRDIDSQKNDLGKKENLLSNNLRETGNLREATAMTKMQNLDILSSRLAQISDQNADPVAKARIMQIKGMMDQQAGQLQQQIAVTKMQQGAFNGQPGQGNVGMALESLPSEMRERAVQLPGGGLAKAYTKEGAKEVRDQLQSIQPIFDSLDQLKALGPSAAITGTPANQKANAIRSQLIPLVNENAGLKRLSGEDIGNIKQMFTDPTTFQGMLTNARTDTFKNFLQNKLMNTMSNQLEGGGGKAVNKPTGKINFKPKGT